MRRRVAIAGVEGRKAVGRKRKQRGGSDLVWDGKRGGCKASETLKEQ